MFLGVFRTHIDTDKLIKGHTKDKPVMIRANAKWLVNHSVRKYVLDDQIGVDKLTKEIKSIKGGMVSQGDLRAIRALAYSSKKLVGKSFATKK